MENSKNINPLKTRMGLNHINTKGWVPNKKGNHEARTQIRTELVKDPVYRIYVTHQNEILNVNSKYKPT